MDREQAPYGVRTSCAATTFDQGMVDRRDDLHPFAGTNADPVSKRRCLGMRWLLVLRELKRGL